MAEHQKFIYVVGTDPGPKKVGIATNPQTRLNAIQTGSPIKLRILATSPCATSDARKLERSIHHILGPRRLYGEWFDVGIDEALGAANSVLSSGYLKKIAPRSDHQRAPSFCGSLGSLERRLERLGISPEDLVSMLQIDRTTLEWHMRQGHPVPHHIRAFLAAWELLADDGRAKLRETLKR